ncbi:tail fiber protein [Olleya sp. HaHaR_3_96]|uniref:tail fiber protein n=1 Tax=Olleya sp. HaHaR_3_96 TaxID=2745560 RepID=UPI001C4F4DFF|nr:tail fiber protein [Olleya sp. HaHaR_3_96]QXP60920.1 hypothetical protein H0I26_04585 [Olleya sp. HaHaR_3_96]
MKKIEFTLLILSIIISLDSYSQEFEWIVDNTGSNSGERIVAIIDAGSIGSYDGIGLTGTVTDYNGNWGYNYPTLSEFTAYVKFSPNLTYGIIQEKSTANIQLRIRKISNSIVHLTANLSPHRGVRVDLKKVIGSPSIVMGNPLVNDSSGELLLDQPSYSSISTTNHSTGDVGIGTTNPDMKLTVKGNIHAEEVKIDLNVPAPDYVFKNDYNLRSIEEVEKFIKENSHLPEIPSAKEFEQNGIMQAEMDMKLLKKIEELTLYTIQQQKEIQTLKEENKSLNLLATKFLELQKRLEMLENKKRY